MKTDISPQNRWQKVKQRINQACAQSQRNPEEIQLIGASKTKPANDIRALFQLGQAQFGENYLNEALTKQEQLQDLDIVWHYIGQIQSNKTKLLANAFDWIHGVDRLKIAERLNQQREHPHPLNVLIQVNLDAEASKGGVMLADTLALAKSIQALPKLRLRGLMALPKPRDNFQQQYDCLLQLQQKLQEINHALALDDNDKQLDTISAGMSNDLEAAIAAGSTMVRIGTDLFGARV